MQRKIRLMESYITAEYENYYLSGRHVKKGYVPNQRNLTFTERETLLALLDANPDTKGLQKIKEKLEVEPLKGYLRKKDYEFNRR